MERKEREVNLRDYVDVIVKRYVIIILSIVVVTVSSLIFGPHQRPLYKATAYVLVEKFAFGSNDLTGKIGVLRVDSEKSLAGKYIESIIKSYGLIDEVMRSVSAENSEDLKKEGELSDSAVVNLTASELQNSILIEQGEGSEIVGVSVVADSPKKSTYLANLIAKVFVDMSRKGLGGGVQAQLRYLEKQSTIFKERIEKNKQILARYGSLPESGEIMGVLAGKQGEMAKLQKDYVEARLNRQMAEARLKVLEERLAKKGPEDRFSVLLSESKELMGLRNKLAELERKRASLLVQFTEEHPNVIEVQMEIDKVKGAIEEEVKRPMEDLRAQIEGLKTKEDTLKQIMETNFPSAPQQEAGKPETDPQITKLRIELATDEKVFPLLLEKTEQLRVEALLESDKIKIVRLATEPKKPEKPQGPPMLLVAISLGLVLGITLAFTQENMDTSLKTIEDVEYYLNQPVVGIIPAINPEKKPKSGP
ncbi:MAG: Wzz/FepE/Etk N-terminal domain-containing protein [Candidatus Omnitrophica bacterium]|nr:Wzz/FepE/Etk N-terminal domain-containing protein [Candidatus Omnitrophota bacterium]